MASQPGEERLITVFADLHYYLSAPSPRPAADRFDKASYLYLHGNTSGRGARLEIANNVGKPEQDAFTGSLGSCTITQSYKHQTLCTVTVDGYKGQHSRESSPALRPEFHWKLPGGNAKEGHSPLSPLHTVDIYFWTVHDADSFIDSLRKLLNNDQLILLDYPPSPETNDQAFSPVVQNLENVAIRDPTYQQGRSSRTDSMSHSQVSSISSPYHGEDRGSSISADTPSFQPLAYNPAAPAAPEPIAHREKTPPPIDTEGGTGLAAAASADHRQVASPPGSLSRPPYGLPYSSSGYVGGPPVQPHTPGYSNATPPSAIGQRTPSFHVNPLLSGQSSTTPHSPLPSFAPPPTQTPASPSSQQLTLIGSASSRYGQSTIGAPSPGSEIMGSSYVGAHHQPLQHVQPQYPDYLASGHQAQGPVGGYSNYQYTQQQQQQPSNSQPTENQYDVHNQVYRPTEQESLKAKTNQRPPEAGPGQRPGTLEKKLSGFDKTFNKVVKRVERRIG